VTQPGLEHAGTRKPSTGVPNKGNTGGTRKRNEGLGIAAPAKHIFRKATNDDDDDFQPSEPVYIAKGTRGERQSQREQRRGADEDYTTPSGSGACLPHPAWCLHARRLYTIHRA
jgi:hypothetical protein